MKNNYFTLPKIHCSTDQYN